MRGRRQYSNPPICPASVYLLQWPAMVKAGYSARRRWRALAQANGVNGCEVYGVWHFPNCKAAFDAETAADEMIKAVGGRVGPDALVGRSGGYRECFTVADPARVLAMVAVELDALGGSRCISPDSCGRRYAPCQISV